MIALVIIPLIFADPDSRKVLIPDETRPSERFAGEDGEGFYDVRSSALQRFGYSALWRSDLSPLVSSCDLPLYSVLSQDEAGFFAVYIEHFIAPTDADNHFEDTPLLTLPSVPEDTLDTQTGPVAPGVPIE
jgi:hypothetical protein